jgi:hypothetical protein
MEKELSRLTNAQARAAIKEERARDAALAVQEYEAEKLAGLAKTARLRELRLAGEARNALNKQPKGRVKRVR